MARLVSQIAKELELHSDNVRAALNAIPTEIALGLTDTMLNDLIRAIDAHSKEVYQQGVKDADKYSRKETLE